MSLSSMRPVAPLGALEDLREIGKAGPQNEFVKAWKSQGKKIVGWLCTYVPEELIHAAGLFPVRVMGEGRGETEEAQAYLYANTCFFARSCLEVALRKDYEFLDLLAAGNTCDPIRRLYDVWRHYLFTPTHMISIPHKLSDQGIDFFRAQLQELRKVLEEMSGQPISRDALRDSIALYNRSRRLLREIYELRRADPPPLSGAEALEMVRAGWTMPREQYLERLKTLREELQDRPPLPPGRARLLISGSLLDQPEFIGAIEALGSWVVTDELCTGTRYFWTDVDEGLDPMEGLARRYLERPPCARMRPYTRRLDHIRQLAREYRVDGVIYETIKFCELYGHDKPMIGEDLEAEGIPVLELDLEYGGGGAGGQVRTRVEAFLEMLAHSS